MSERFSEDEIDAIYKYTGHWHGPINEMFRNGSSPHADRIAPIVTHLDAAIQKGSNKAITLYRGVRGIAQPTIGSTWIEPAFMSTSTDLKEASSFAGRDGFVYMISVPRGIRHLRSPSIHEREEILPRDLRMTVTSIDGPIVLVKVSKS